MQDEEILLSQLGTLIGINNYKVNKVISEQLGLTALDKKRYSEEELQHRKKLEMRMARIIAFQIEQMYGKPLKKRYSEHVQEVYRRVRDKPEGGFLDVLQKNPNYLEKLDKLLERVPSLCQLSSKSSEKGSDGEEAERPRKRNRMNMDVLPVKKVMDSQDKFVRSPTKKAPKSERKLTAFNIKFPIADSDDDLNERQEVPVPQTEVKPFAYGKLKIAEIARQEQYRGLFDSTGGDELAGMEKEQKRIEDQQTLLQGWVNKRQEALEYVNMTLEMDNQLQYDTSMTMD